MDLSSAHDVIKILYKLVEANVSENLTIGSGKPTSIRDIVNAFSSISGVSIDIAKKNNYDGDTFNHSCPLAANEYHSYVEYSPKRSVDCICREIYNFYQSGK